jgi:hypothetical protein
MWGVVTTALDRVQREPDRIKERERLDEEVAKAETAATKSTTLGSLTSYSPEGSKTKFYSEDSFNKYMQAIRKRDKHIAAQLDEEEAVIKTLPAAAETLKQSQLDKINKQRSTLQLEEPGAKKTEVTPAVPTPTKPDVLSNKPTSAPVVSESIAPKLPAEYSKEVNSRKDLTPEQKKEQIDRYTNGYNQIKKQEADLTTRAKADPTMKGNKFGKYVDEKGVEVFDSNGKLIGHYK